LNFALALFDLVIAGNVSRVFSSPLNCDAMPGQEKPAASDRTSKSGGWKVSAEAKAKADRNAAVRILSRTSGSV
jgi:hypothetical protein